MGGKANSALRISCGTVGLLRICLDSIMTNGLSNWFQVEGERPGAQTTDAYMREGVTNESKSHPLVRGSWKCAWWHYLSKSERVIYIYPYPFVTLSVVIFAIENLLIRAIKVTSRYTYELTTSTCLLENIRLYLVRN